MSKLLQVIANPWASIDEQARPTGAILMDLDEHNPKGGKYIGARLVATEVSPKKWRRVGNAVETTELARFDRTWVFSASPVDVPATRGGMSGYYQDRVRRNELLAADELSARAAGVKFRKPEEVIAESKSARRAEYDAQHGDGAFDAAQPADPNQITAEPKRAAKPNKN